MDGIRITLLDSSYQNLLMYLPLIPGEMASLLGSALHYHRLALPLTVRSTVLETPQYPRLVGRWAVACGLATPACLIESWTGFFFFLMIEDKKKNSKSSGKKPNTLACHCWLCWTK